MSGHSRTPTDSLTAAEAETARAIVVRDGLAAAARSLGIGQVALAKAIAGAVCHRMTVAVIRMHLTT